MKTFLKPCIKILVLLFVFTLFNCEKDDEFIPEKVVIQNFKITKINESDLNQNLLSKLENINKKSKASDRLITSENHDFIISTNSGSYLETIDGLYHSYTFPIIRNSESDFLENIMFSKHIDEDYKIKLITYEVSSEEKEILRNGGVVDLEGKVSTQEINDDNLTSDVFSRTVDCVTIIITYCTGSENHPGGMENGMPCPYYAENTIFDNCGGGSGGATTGGASGDIDPTDLGNNNNTNNGGGVNNNYNGVAFSNPTFNASMAEQLALALDMTLSEFPLGLEVWANKDDNKESVDEIKNFLLEVKSDGTSEDIEEANMSARIVLDLASSGNLTNFSSSEYETILEEHLPPTGLAGFFLKYQEHVQREAYTIIVTEYEDGHVFTKWEIVKIFLRAHKDAIHFGLDVAGMTPGIGIVFDVTNATLYAFSMDWTNSTLSLASGIPLVGQWVTASKLAKKVVVLASGKKVYLKAYNLIDGIIKFSNRGQLRKILGITDSSIHAHHIIPYSQGSNELVQMAAKSNNVWHINDIYNGIPMLNSLHLTGHSAYTNRVIERMDNIFEGLSSPTAYDEAYTGLMSLCDEIKLLIENNPTLNAGELANMF